MNKIKTLRLTQPEIEQLINLLIKAGNYRTIIDNYREFEQYLTLKNKFDLFLMGPIETKMKVYSEEFFKLSITDAEAKKLMKDYNSNIYLRRLFLRLETLSLEYRKSLLTKTIWRFILNNGKTNYNDYSARQMLVLSWNYDLIKAIILPDMQDWFDKKYNELSIVKGIIQ